MSATIDHIETKGVEIPIIYEKQDTLPTFDLQLVFANGGYIDDKDKSGLASLSAKLLNEGTKKLGSVEFAKKLENRAISLGVSSGFETFVVEISCLKEEHKEALRLLGELLKDPNYTDSAFEKIKKIELGKLQRKENDYDYIAGKNLKEIIFKGTPLQNPSSGKPGTISKIQLSDIKKHISETLNLSNLIIVAGGDITLDEIKNGIKNILAILKEGKKRTLPKYAALDSQKEFIEKKDTQQAYIYFGSPYDIEAKDEDVYLAKVASFILGGSGFGSRLMEEIRVKRGLAYSAYGYVSINKSYSYFTGYLQTKLESADEAKKLVKSIVANFVKKGVTKKELEGAKKFLLGSEPLRVETLSQRLSRAFMLYYRGLPLDYPKHELEKIEKIKLKDLNAFIKSHAEIEKLSFSIVTK